MTRLAKDRDTQLTRAEIAIEALRQFDQTDREPSIRSLAAALHVAPSAIYHHFPSREAIIRAAVRSVWRESLTELLEIMPRPLEADPREVLVACGIATRRAWLAHYRLAPYLAASPEVDGFTRDGIGLLAHVFEQIGLSGTNAAEAFHSYMSFMVGSVLFAAARRAANERLGADGGEPAPRFRIEPSADPGKGQSDATLAAIVEMVDLSVVDPARDEQQFAAGLSKLVASLTAVDFVSKE